MWPQPSSLFVDLLTVIVFAAGISGLWGMDAAQLPMAARSWTVVVSSAERNEFPPRVRVSLGLKVWAKPDYIVVLSERASYQSGMIQFSVRVGQ